MYLSCKVCLYRMLCTSILNKIPRHISSCAKTISTDSACDSNDISPIFYNRNPRNLERLRIALKPSGYRLDVPGRSYWHKLFLEEKRRQVIAKIVHFSGSTVVTASTSEYSIKKHLYRPTDVAAYHNLGRVFAERCLESGITEVFCDIKAAEGGKVAAFLSTFENGGVQLTEPDVYVHPQPSDRDRPEKPWEVTE